MLCKAPLFLSVKIKIIPMNDSHKFLPVREAPLPAATAGFARYMVCVCSKIRSCSRSAAAANSGEAAIRAILF